MAFAMIPPHMAAAMNRAKAERDAMNSVDPVERWMAKERAFNRGMAQMSDALIAEAKSNAKAYQKAVEDGEKYIIN